MSMIRVMLADDHEVVRAGLRALFDPHPDIEVVADTADGQKTVDKVLSLRPDVAVVDFKMPGLTGAEVIERIRTEAPEVRVLVLSAYEDRGIVRQALQVGARGYLLKRAAADELVRAVRVVAGGGTYLDPSLAAYLVDGLANGGPGKGGHGPALSDREETVLRLIARGYANKEIAVRLRVSVKTVETYKVRSMEKLGLRGRVDVVRYAHQHGWLADDGDA